MLCLNCNQTYLATCLYVDAYKKDYYMIYKDHCYNITDKKPAK